MVDKQSRDNTNDKTHSHYIEEEDIYINTFLFLYDIEMLMILSLTYTEVYTGPARVLSPAHARSPRHIRSR